VNYSIGSLGFEVCEYKVINGGGYTVWHEGAGGNVPGSLCPTALYADCSICPAPVTLSADTIDFTSAWLAWIQYGTVTTWELMYDLSGFNPVGHPSIGNITSNPYLLTGLDAGTCYDFYVRSDCDGPFSNWIGPYTFCTACNDTLDTFPYLQCFKGGIWPPVCWTIESTSIYETWMKDDEDAPDYFATCFGDHNGGQSEYLISPIIDFSGFKKPLLSFNWQTAYNPAASRETGDVILRYSVDGGDNWGPNEWDESQEGEFDSWTWYYKEIDLTIYKDIDDFRIAFEYVGTDGSQFILDNVAVHEAELSTNWTGLINNNWYELGNWTSGQPFSPTGANVPSSAVVEIENAASCDDMIINPGGEVIVMDGSSLQIASGVEEGETTIKPKKNNSATKTTYQKNRPVKTVDAEYYRKFIKYIHTALPVKDKKEGKTIYSENIDLQ